MPTGVLNTVPITETPLPEATTHAELLDRLRRIHVDGLPGFVIRAAGLTDVGADTHEKVAGVLSNALLDNPNWGWEPSGRVIKLTLAKLSQGEGALHHDARTGLDPEFRIQRTKSGSGKVHLTNAGSLGNEIPMQMEDDADGLFQQGVVNPSAVSPQVHTAELGTGDMVIFPPEISASNSHNKAGPVWHRFDTSSPERQGEVLAVKLKK